MKRIVLISCASTKLLHKSEAKNLYISPLFKLSLKYAKSLNPDNIFILSAKHGLLHLEKRIAPYNLTLNDMKTDKIKKWAKIVIRQLEESVNLKRDEIILFAGEKYRRYLISHLSNCKIPLKGLSIGRQLKYLKQETSNE